MSLRTNGTFVAALISMAFLALTACGDINQFEAKDEAKAEKASGQSSSADYCEDTSGISYGDWYDGCVFVQSGGLQPNPSSECFYDNGSGGGWTTDETTCNLGGPGGGGGAP